MKTLLKTTFLASASLLLAFSGFSETVENFNFHASVNVYSAKNYLQGKCWQFPGFDINTNGYVPGIEGDGAMVSMPTMSLLQNAGIYTPVLDISGNLVVGFKYKFNHNVTSRRWLKIYLTESNNQVIQLLDSLDLTNSLSNTVYNYDQTLAAKPGAYKIFISYQGDGGSVSIGIDELRISANQRYANGCNESPVAITDLFSGTGNHTATGNLLMNDYDPNNETMSAYLLTDSPDGTVSVSLNGDFAFAPNPGFTGNSTTFTYNVCDNGENPMCSQPVTVNLNFPLNSTPVNMINFLANYANNAVVLNWSTTIENSNSRFEIQRSLDGLTFGREGTVRGQGISGISNVHTYIDRVPVKLAGTKDLYYRIKQIDQGGKSVYSKVLILRVYDTESLDMVSVTPNPVKNDIKVNVQLKESSQIVMKVIDGSGKEVIKKSSKGIVGENYNTIEGTSTLSKGLYFLQVIVNNREKMIVKIIKD